MEEKQQGHKIRDILTIIFKHKHIILISFISSIIITLLIAFVLPIDYFKTQYVARSVLMVKFGREFSAISEVGEGRPPINQEAIVNAEMQILTSRDLIDKVITEMGTLNIYPKLAKENIAGVALQELAITTFLQNVFVKDVKRSNLIEVYFRHENPYVAAKALGYLIDFFKEKHLQVFSDSKTTFLEEQLKSYEENLKESETKLAMYKQQYNVVDLNGQKGILLKLHADIDLVLRTEQSRVSELQRRYDFTKNQKEIVTEGVTNDIRVKLNEAQRKEQDLLQRYSENNRTIIEVRKQIQLLKDQLQKQEEDIRKAELTRIDTELKPLESKVASLRRQQEQLNKEIQVLDSRDKEHRELQRNLINNEANYTTYLKKFEESRIQEDMDQKKMTNIIVVQKATAPIQPIPSNRNKVLLAGIFLSIAFSFGLAFIVEYIPQGLTLPDSAEKRLRLPVISVISEKKK